MSDNVATLKRASIEVGSIVKLKTDGPRMVVEARIVDKAHCWWHNNEGDLVHDWLPINCLEVVK